MLVSLFGPNRHSGPSPLADEGRLADFDGAAGWLNSEPLTPAGLRGKVVLVDFWTYTCINWLRTLGYVRAWADRYRDKGLVLVGVHTPEFWFEQDADNVRRAVQDMRIEYPVALDPDYKVWRAFANHYWPAVYIADAEGRIRHHQFGEGRYDECERVIQQLLRDAGARDVGSELTIVSPEGIEAQADWTNLESGETYLGYEQAQNFASPGFPDYDRPRAYEVPETLMLNRWALGGDWTIEGGASVLNEAGGRIAFRFHARDVNLVLRSRSGATVPFRVRLDGQAPGAAHGLDAGEDGHGTLAEPRLYQLVREPGMPIVDRTFEIVFDAPGAEAYVFTFG